MADTLADNLKEVNARKMSETLTYLKATSPVTKLAEIKAINAGKTLRDTGQIAVVTPSATVAEVLEKTFKNKLTYVKFKAPVKKVVDTPADVNV